MYNQRLGEDYEQLEELRAGLAKKEIDLQEGKKAVLAARSRQGDIVMIEAAKLYKDAENRLETAYKVKKASLYGAFTMALLYGLLATVLTACRSGAIRSDFKAILVGLREFAIEIQGNALKWQNSASEWVLLLLVGGAAILLIGILLYKIVDYYAEELLDNKSLWVTLISLAAIVWFADPISERVPLNLFLVLFLIQGVYIAIRRFGEE